ncbi:response regulator [Methylobacterium pseudosasicola]|uniref:response regulator n=1 Tax=Methylobacterium pseudosasicola TaxID=582667 RepID=UPI001FCCF888|nr:response regulator [Methylobacterium pseudosasicola]
MGEGTTITVYLSRVAARALAKAAVEPVALVDGHGTRVLVVEDNVDVGTFAVQSLSDLGYAPTLAVDGNAALAELAKNPERFDVVFSDVMMPGMSGIELGQEIRRLYHDLTVVLTSGYSHVLAQNGTYGFELLAQAVLDRAALADPAQGSQLAATQALAQSLARSKERLLQSCSGHPLRCF